METQSEQEKMDQLMAELQGSAGADDTKAPPAAAVADTAEPVEEISEQEKMDRLMAELQGEATSDKEEPAATAPADAGEPEEELDEQAKMDRLMAELQGGTDPGEQAESAEAEPAEVPEPEEELDEQAKMDRLMAELQGDADSPEDSETRLPEETGEADSEPPEEDLGSPAAAGEDEDSDEFQALDDDEADLDGYGGDTFESLEDDEEDLDGYTDSDVEEKPEAVQPLEAAAEPETEISRKPVPRERKSLFNIQEERVSALPERIRQGQWPRIVLVSAGITVLLAILFGGLVIYKSRGVVSPEKGAARLEDPQEQQHAEAPPEEKPTALPEPEAVEPLAISVENPADSIIQDRFETIDTLRQSLQIKQAEITTLKKDYENGVEHSMGVISELSAEKQIKDFKAAMAVRRIAYELQTIQRRKAYIRKLDRPYKRLLSGNEALLYIKRLTEIDLAVGPFVGGLETGQLLKRIDAEIDRHQLTGDKLMVAVGDAGVPGIEALWREALLKGRDKKAGGQSAQDPAGGNILPVEEVKLSNPEIWEQICNGQPDNKYRLTELSSEAAGCLAKWKGKELFLNRLTTLTARQAQALADWNGEWIGLNGLAEMDRATARALFKWRGKRLSLNGFAEFPPGIARYLAKWKGQQLELMGLEILSHKTAVYFSEWKKGGGELYIPNKFYRRK